jgi:predicted amidohydrolase
MEVQSNGWRRLASAFANAIADIALLNELPFGSWIAGGEFPSAALLESSRKAHDAGMLELPHLETRVVLGTRPVAHQSGIANEAFVWERSDKERTGRVRAIHTKQFFPDEAGYHEARWFTRGETHFSVAEAGKLRVGFLICTEVMFTEWARHYGRSGAQLIAVPRATPLPSVRRWKTALSMAAIVSGCYVASSNRGGTDRTGQEYGAGGWIFDPLGDLIAETTADEDVVTAELDMSLVKRAQREYPCYVAELPVPANACN